MQAFLFGGELFGKFVVCTRSTGFSLSVFVQEVHLPSLEEGIGVLRLVGVWLWWGLGVFSKLVALRLFDLGFC